MTLNKAEKIAGLLGNYKARNKDEYLALCPAHDDTSPSLNLKNDSKGNLVFHCFVCGNEGKDQIAQKIKELDSDILKTDNNKNYVSKFHKLGFPLTYPPEAVLRSKGYDGPYIAENTKHYVTHYPYHDFITDKLRGYNIRYERVDTETGEVKKDHIPYFKRSPKNPNYLRSGFPEGLKDKRPLYIKDKQINNKTILVVEGEKCVDKIHLNNLDRGYTPLTWIGGSRSVVKADWESLKESNIKHAILWPDNDKSGFSAMKTVERILRQDLKIKYISLVDINYQGYHEGFDSYDYYELFKDKKILPDLRPSDLLSTAETTQASTAEVEPEQLDGDRLFTDLGSANRFLTQWQQKLYYVSDFNKWMYWDGKKLDAGNEQTVELMKDTARNVFQLANREREEEVREAMLKYAANLQSESKISSALKLARTDKRVCIKSDLLDQDKYIINLDNGIYDLNTREFKKRNKSKMLLSKIAPVKYEKEAKCERFLRFLNEIFLNDLDLIHYIQKVFGYVLSGDVNERVFFIFWGAGRNGKSTLAQTFFNLLGDDYSATASAEMILRGKHEGGIPNDIARLKGKRYCVISETEEGKTLAEGKIKSLTGNERIQARFLHAEFFEFRPEFKLFYLTNPKPSIRGSDPAIWDRLKMIPFEHRLEIDEVDFHLENKLKAESSGILNWAIEGYNNFMSEGGLGSCDAVKNAVDLYREESNSLLQFIDESIAITKEPHDNISYSDLFTVYKTWCNERSEYILSQRRFVEKLKNMLDIPEQLRIAGKKAKGFTGVKLINEASFPNPNYKKEDEKFLNNLF